MKCIRKSFLALGIILIVLAGFVVQCPAASPFNIGVIHDCKTISDTQMLNDIKKEVISLTKGEFDVRFPPKYNLVSDCSKNGIKGSIDRLIKNPDVDMVLALGPLGSQVLGRYKNYPKPCIAGFVINPELQGIPFAKRTSGKNNLAYVVQSPNLKNNIARFRELAAFKTVAFLYDKSIYDLMETGNKILHKIEKENDIRIVLQPVDQDLQGVKAQLPEGIEAVFMGHLVDPDIKGLARLIDDLNESRIPSFSLNSRQMVKKGLLAGFDQTLEIKRFARRIAILTQRILLKENPKDFKVDFNRQQNLVINMQTVQKLDISPDFSLLARAELINQKNSPERSRLEKKSDTSKNITLSSLVTDESDGLDAAAFGLNETQGSLSLLDAVNRAIENNLILKARGKETEAGKMNVKKALSRFYPQLGAGLNFTAIDDAHTSAISGLAERSWDISARVSQLLYSDAVYTNLKTSRHLQKVQELSEHQERLDIILETGLAYLNMLKARASARILLDNLKLVRSNLVLANNRYQAGASGPSDVYRLESEAAIAYSNFLSALAAVGQARLRLNQILNLDQENNTSIQDVRLDDGLFIVSDPKMRSILKIKNPREFRKFRDFFVQKGLEASPEVKAIDEQIAIQNDAYHLAKRSYWSPNISVNALVGNTFSKSGDGSELDSSALPPPLDTIFKEPDDTRWSASLVLDVPFYEGGGKSADRIKAFETKNQLTFFKYNIQNQISENIRSALYSVSASHPSIELTSLSASSARKNLDLVQDAYSKGAVSIINFLDAQNAALVANTLAENAVYEFFIDYFISERAAGNYTLFLNQSQREQWIQEFQK